MRCEECLTLVEEYHDGELERRQTERVSAHLAACADCAAALDALTFEEEIFLRYERGVEVSPALWQGVRAAVARLDETEQAGKPLPPLTRLRGLLAASLGALSRRSALASSLALLVAAVILGTLWLAQRGTETPVEVAVSAPLVGDDGRGPAVAPGPIAPPSLPAGKDVVTVAGPQTGATIRPAAGNAADLRITNAGVVNANVRRVPFGVAVSAPPPAPDHLGDEDELPSLAGGAAAGEGDVVAAANARLLTPEEKEMARHLEQAQALLLSFQNAPAAEADAAQVAYERRLSRRLLSENTTLQFEAETAGDKGTKQVLDTLEPFLLDIANLRDNASRDDVRSIKERMRKTEIIAALQVY